MSVSLLRPVVISHLITSSVVMTLTARQPLVVIETRTSRIVRLTSHSWCLELWLLGDASFDNP